MIGFSIMIFAPWGPIEDRGLVYCKDISIFSCITLPSHVESAFKEAFTFIPAAPGDELQQLRAYCAGGNPVDVVMTGLGCEPLTDQAINALPPSIRMIATYSVGTDHIDLDAAKACGLAVANTPGVLVDAVADAALFLILGAARRATESISLIRGGWPGWHANQLLGFELAGKTLGIYGMGEIGEAIAQRGRSFGMDIAYHNRRQRPDIDATFYADPLALVATSDVLLIAAPSTPQTRGFVNAATLSRAKSTAIVVNMARGDLVVDDDLIAALKEGRIFGAALDVFANEPDIHPGYFTLPNLFMTPHIGSSTLEARLAMGHSLIRSINASLGDRGAS